ncbi:transposase family protein [Streptomyces sp. NPDC012637]|uniref:transposase family protein n=1 Tax=Streptomyces sp. NPDC012637 TaxID=3364842 RepID=UPI0036EF8C3C
MHRSGTRWCSTGSTRWRSRLFRPLSARSRWWREAAAAAAACPDCGRFSDRVHDRYQRRLKDLPLAEQGFVIRLTVRRFICGSADCPRRTFAEPFSRLAARTHGSPRGSTTLWSGWVSPSPGGPALGWLPSWASAREE